MLSTAHEINNQSNLDLQDVSRRIRVLEALLARPTQYDGPKDSDELEDGEGGNGQLNEFDDPTLNFNNNSAAGNIGTTTMTPGSLSRRVLKMETKLKDVTRERAGIDDFLKKLQASSNLLTTNILGKGAAHTTGHSDRDLLTLQAKTELILAGQEELEKLAEEAKIIQELERCAEIGGLKTVGSQYPVLAKLETVHIEQSEQSAQVSATVNKLMVDYNAFISAISEIFLSWDALLTAAENKVSQVERSTR